MEKKNEDSVLEFESFMNSVPVAPPLELSLKVSNFVRNELNPSSARVFSKFAFVHLFVGTATLLICPQFGINFFPGLGLVSLFMKLGEVGCTFACGALFLGSTALICSFVLSASEVKVLRKNRILQLTLLASLSFGVLISLGSGVLVLMAVAWLMGSVLAGSVTLEFGWRLRAYFRRRLIYGP